MTKRLSLLLLLPLLAALLVACGQKGPLFLPEPPAEQTDNSGAAAS